MIDKYERNQKTKKQHNQKKPQQKLTTKNPNNNKRGIYKTKKKDWVIQTKYAYLYILKTVLNSDLMDFDEYLFRKKKYQM